ncbi:MAG: glycosyltransferase family 4 protein [Gemmatimonadaceae bacterium]
MKRRPSLLWVNHFAIPTGEGGGTRHFEVGRELVQRGWRVTIAASDFNLHTRRYSRRADATCRDVIAEQVDGVDFRWLWAAPYQRNDWHRAANWLSFAQSLLRWDPGSDCPDVVIGSSPHLFAALAAERLAARWRVPFVLEVRDLWPESLLAAGGRKGPAYMALDRIAQYLYRRSRRIIVLARGSGRHLAERGIDERKISYVPNGVDADAFVRAPSPLRDDFTVVYAGAHGPANGLDIVLGAAALLREHGRIKFLLVGDGPEKIGLVEAARARGLENVEFRGLIPKTQMPALLAEADTGLMVLKDSPLFAYGVSPNKLFDYLGASLPVVSNVPGEVAEMLQASAAGEQAEPGSARSLADAILRTAGRAPAERARMGERGRAWVSREHGRPVLAGRLDSTLRDLVPQ